MAFNIIHTPPHLVNEHFDDRYFDVFNAIEEAHHIYFKGCDLLLRAAEKSKQGLPFVTGETGFGAGRILLAFLDLLEKSEITDLNLVYQSVELYPIGAERMATILEGFKVQVGESIDTLTGIYSQFDIEIKGWQKVIVKRRWGTLELRLFFGEAMEMLSDLNDPCDHWFLEGHGPKKNPTIWRDELLEAIGPKTVEGGTCATYTVAVAVRKALIRGGFDIELPPGFGGKKSVLKGTKITL